MPAVHVCPRNHTCKKCADRKNNATGYERNNTHQEAIHVGARQLDVHGMSNNRLECITSRLRTSKDYRHALNDQRSNARTKPHVLDMCEKEEQSHG